MRRKRSNLLADWASTVNGPGLTADSLHWTIPGIRTRGNPMKYKKSQAKDASRAHFRGIWAAITTPFTPALELDEAGLRQNMRYLTGTLRVDGVFCTGVMGEYWSLTKEERKRI